MSAPLKNQIQTYIMMLDSLVSKPLPSLPGPTATPNKRSRDYCSAKRVYEELKTIEVKLLEANVLAMEYIAKTRAANRNAVSKAYTEWINNLQVTTKKLELLKAKTRWE